MSEQAQNASDTQSSAQQRLSISAEIALEIRQRGSIDSAARLRQELALHARFRAAFDVIRGLL